MDVKIDKIEVEKNLRLLLKKIFSLPEVTMVCIRKLEMYAFPSDSILCDCIEKSYHDVFSDVDIHVHVTLHPTDIADGQGYLSNPRRFGFTRDNYLGLSFPRCKDAQQMYRVILKNGMRYDLIFHITSDENAPIYSILQSNIAPITDEGYFWPRWDLTRTDEFWFIAVQALGKLYRNDYLIADHLANLEINETLNAQLVIRDNAYGTSHHRYGHQEILDYRKSSTPPCPYANEDETFNFIAQKLYSAALCYDELIAQLNPEYENRSEILFSIWGEYNRKL